MGKIEHEDLDLILRGFADLDMWIIVVVQSEQHVIISPQCANRNKSGLLFSSAEMFKKPV